MWSDAPDHHTVVFGINITPLWNWWRSLQCFIFSNTPRLVYSCDLCQSMRQDPGLMIYKYIYHNHKMWIHAVTCCAYYTFYYIMYSVLLSMFAHFIFCWLLRISKTLWPNEENCGSWSRYCKVSKDNTAPNEKMWRSVFIVIISLTWVKSKKFIVFYCYGIPEKTKINSKRNHAKGHVLLTEPVYLIHLTDPVHLTDTIHLTEAVHLTDTVHLTDFWNLNDFVH